MAITTLDIKSTSIDNSLVGIEWTFTATKSDDNYLEDPLYEGVQVVSKAICMDAAGALKVTYANGRVDTIPSGALAPGVWHPMRIVKVWSTGSGSQAVVIGVGCGYGSHDGS